MIFTIENEYLSVAVEETGAQLKSIYHKESKTEFLWQGDPKYWKGRAYNLFPIVGRLYDGKYIYDGKTYELERHGFARNKKFYRCEKSSDKMTFNISSDENAVVDAVAGTSVVGLRLAMTLLPILVLVIAVCIFRKKYTLTDKRLEEISEQLKQS